MMNSRMRVIAYACGLLAVEALLALLFGLLISSVLLSTLLAAAAVCMLAVLTAKLIAGQSEALSRRLADLASGELASKPQTGDPSAQQLEEAIKYISWVAADMGRTLDDLARGDLSTQPGDQYKGDFRSLRDSLNAVLATMNQCVGDIACTTAAAHAYSTEISDTSRRLADSSTEQAGAIAHLSQSMAMVAERAIHSTKLAHSMAESGESVKKLAIVGAEQMGHMMQAVQDINDAGKSIESVIKIIDDIAFQTNILALNAAVEAARAGQHGKGFGVVADEVRQLAGKSADAAQQTSALISNTIQKAEEGFNISQETRRSLEQILDGIQDVTGSIVEISEGSDTQAQEIKTVNALLEEQAVAVHQNSSSSELTAEYGQAMKDQAASLHRMVQRFRLDNKHARKVQASQVQARNIKMIKPQQADDNSSLYTKLIWDDALKMGDDMIDSQHRQLIEMVDGLLASCFNGTAEDELNKAMGFLLDYTVKHFADEEELQRKCGFPGYQRHKQIHDAFAAKAVNLASELERKGPTPEMIGAINKELVDWLLNHIKGEDKKISQYLKH